MKYKFLDLKKVAVFYNKRNGQYSIALPKKKLGKLPKYIDLTVKPSKRWNPMSKKRLKKSMKIPEVRL